MGFATFIDTKSLKLIVYQYYVKCILCHSLHDSAILLLIKEMQYLLKALEWNVPGKDYNDTLDSFNIIKFLLLFL